MELDESIKRFYERLNKACSECGRNANEISVVPATKCVKKEIVLSLPSFGFTDVGENRVQEFNEKYVPDIGLKWHIIGALQTNKVKYTVGKVAMIQSVDRMSLAEEISRLSRLRGVTTDVLVEVNVGAEENKSGVDPSEALEFCDKVAELGGIRLRGLMSVPPKGAITALYEKMYKLYSLLKSKYAQADTLSMGMSEDFETAVKCGSNMVRPGRVLFGERDCVFKNV